MLSETVKRRLYCCLTTEIPSTIFFEWMIKSEDKLLGGEKINDLKDCPQVKRLHFKKDIHGKFKGRLSQNNSLSIKKFVNLMLPSHYTVDDLEDLIFQASHMSTKIWFLMSNKLTNRILFNFSKFA